MGLVKVANGLDWIGMDWNTTSTPHSIFTTSPHEYVFQLHGEIEVVVVAMVKVATGLDWRELAWAGLCWTGLVAIHLHHPPCTFTALPANIYSNNLRK